MGNQQGTSNHILQRGKGSAGQERPFYILDAGFDFSLCLSPIGTAQTGLVAIVAAKVFKRRVQAGVVGTAVQYDGTGIVIEYLFCHAAEPAKGAFVAAKQSRQFLIQCEFDIDGA